MRHSMSALLAPPVEVRSRRTLRRVANTVAIGAFLILAGPQHAANAQAAEVPSEIVARLPQSVGGVTFTADRAMIVSHHPNFDPAVRVARVDEAGTTATPFPNAAWNTPRPGTDEYLDSVLGLRGDEQGVVWMLDMGQRTNVTPKIVGWNTRTDRLERLIRIPAPASLPVSQHNDLVVDRVNGVFYIADEAVGRGGDGSLGALVVVDMKTGAARRLLQSHVSTRPENIPIIAGGNTLRAPGPDGKPKPVTIGADGIAADVRFEWLYYGPLNGGWVYRVRTADLRDAALPPARLAAHVERYARKPNAGGFSIDGRDNLYLTEVGAGAVDVIPADTRRYRRLVERPQDSWPDGVTFGPDGLVYVAAAQVDKAAAFNGGASRAHPPFVIYRFRPLAPGRIGH